MPHTHSALPLNNTLYSKPDAVHILTTFAYPWEEHTGTLGKYIALNCLNFAH